MSKKSKVKGAKSEKKSVGAAPAKPAAMAKRSASQEEQRFALISRALADPTRMSILRKVASGQVRCGDVKECLGVSAATLSHHLKELGHAGLVTLQREGRFVNASVEKKVWKQYIADLKSLLR